MRQKLTQVTLVLTVLTINAACSKVLEENKRVASPSKDGGDQTAGIGSDEGCKTFFADGKDASLDVNDLSGSKHPLCSVLTEANIEYLFVLPYVSGCQDCVDSALAAQKAIVAANVRLQVKVALVGEDTRVMNEDGVSGDDLLLFGDDDAGVFKRLAKLGFNGEKQRLYALGKTRGTLFNYAKDDDVAIAIKALGLKADDEKEFDILRLWDGRNNMSDPEVVVEQL